jgi:hypothetical protein
LGSASDAYANSEAKLAAAHRALLHTRGLQLDFATAPPQPPPPPWLIDLLKALGEFGPVLRYVFWGGLAVALALIVWFIAREVVASRLPTRTKAVAPVDWRPDALAARALLEQADALAGEGRYGEAVHLLLFRSIEDLVGRRPGVVRPALTSRDIAALEVMPAGPRGAFARIAERVETGFFGGRLTDAADFAAARGDYQAFAFAEDWVA